MKFSILKYLCLSLILSTTISCESFLDRAPGDSLSKPTFWQTEDDAIMASTACYNGWMSGSTIIYLDCASDNSYNNFPWEGWNNRGNGGMSSSNTGASTFGYSVITKCNDLLANIDKCTFTTDGLKNTLIAEARFIRAFRYMIMAQDYGSVPLVTEPVATIEESRIPKADRDVLVDFILTEFKAAEATLPTEARLTGSITKGAAQAMQMRFLLNLKRYKESSDMAKVIIESNQYSLFNSFPELFEMKNEGNSEVILDVQYIAKVQGLSVIGQMYNNGDGGWSSIVPLQSLVDEFETADGLTIDEWNGYDATQPYKNRDPRLRATVIFPGQIWSGTNGPRVFDPLTSGTPDHPRTASASSQSGYTYKKYTNPISQYDDIWDTGMNVIVCRYAEVLLSYAEANIELNNITDEVYNAIDLVRERAKMPVVDRTKYNSQSTLRQRSEERRVGKEC